VPWSVQKRIFLISSTNNCAPRSLCVRTRCSPRSQQSILIFRQSHAHIFLSLVFHTSICPLFLHVQKNVEFCANISFIVSQFRIDLSLSLSLVLSLSLPCSCFGVLKNERSDCSANKITQRDRSPLISIPGTPILFARELNYKRPSVSQRFSQSCASLRCRWIKSFIDITKSLCRTYTRFPFLSLSLSLSFSLNQVLYLNDKNHKNVLSNFIRINCFLFLIINLTAVADDFIGSINLFSN